MTAYDVSGRHVTIACVASPMACRQLKCVACGAFASDIVGGCAVSILFCHLLSFFIGMGLCCSVVSCH